MAGVNTISRDTPALLWRVTAALQAALYILTGIWPIADPVSFQAVTGPKTDVWLVQLFGALICVPGLACAVVAWTGQWNGAVAAIAPATAAVLLTGDAVYVLRGVIGPVYLLDAAAELLLLCGWAGAWAMRHAPGLPRGTRARTRPARAGGTGGRPGKEAV